MPFCYNVIVLNLSACYTFIINIFARNRDETHQEAFIHSMVAFTTGVGLRVSGSFSSKF